MVLLRVLKELAVEYQLTLAALHVDHRLRSGSAAEAQQVRAWCADLDIPCNIRQIDVQARRQNTGESIQEAARFLRYEALQEAINSARSEQPSATWRIAVGHTADDQAETVLLRLLRGTGPTGLAGIPPRRGHIVRPLMDVWRQEVIAFCDHAGLPYLTDVSNQSFAYVRNRVRLELIPHIESNYNPRFRHALGRLAELVQADEAVFEDAAEAAFRSPALAGAKGQGWAQVRAAGLAELPLGTSRRVLRLLFQYATGRMGPAFERLEAARALAQRNTRGGAIVELGGHAIAMRQGPWVVIRQQ